MKGVEKLYSAMLFSKTVTETFLSKKPKNPETNLKHGIRQ